MRIINEIKLDFDDVLIAPKRSKTPSRSKVEVARSFKTINSKKELSGIPVIAANMDCTGTFAMAKAFYEHQMFVCLHKFYPENKLIEFFNQEHSKYSFYTIGMTEEDVYKLKQVRKSAQIPNICIDVANGYSEVFQDHVKNVRELFPKAVIMAGNVVTQEMTHEIILAGADIVKLGIGPGSVCMTRKVTGVGYPQLSCVIECADTAHGMGGLVCSDGGCKQPGDVVKAFGGGADFVMLGGMVAGTDECEGEWKVEYEIAGNEITGRKIRTHLKFYGMSSTEAMNKYSGGVASYKASEGRCEMVPYKGPVDETIQQVLGGIRSACCYVGATKLKDLSKCTTFVRIR
jgi:GMP reductase